MSDSFNVVVFYRDGSYQYEQRNVSAEKATDSIVHLCSCVGAKIGWIDRIIITDSGDCCNFEWQYGKGVVFPPENTSTSNQVVDPTKL